MSDPKSYEEYYCGKCNRSQLPKEGEKCKHCGGRTVSWFPNREKFEDAQKRWKHFYGK